MNKTIRRVVTFTGILLVVLLLNLTWVQAIHGPDLRTTPVTSPAHNSTNSDTSVDKLPPVELS